MTIGSVVERGMLKSCGNLQKDGTTIFSHKSALVFPQVVHVLKYLPDRGDLRFPRFPQGLLLLPL